MRYRYSTHYAPNPFSSRSARIVPPRLIYSHCSWSIPNSSDLWRERNKNSRKRVWNKPKPLGTPPRIWSKISSLRLRASWVRAIISRPSCSNLRAVNNRVPSGFRGYGCSSSHFKRAGSITPVCLNSCSLATIIGSYSGFSWLGQLGNGYRRVACMINQPISQL